VGSECHRAAQQNPVSATGFSYEARIGAYGEENSGSSPNPGGKTCKVHTKGLVIVNTGDGKGKTTAGLGLVLRAWGHDMRVCVIQFLKNGNLKSGEARAAAKLGIEWHALGDGYTWSSRDIERSRARAIAAWETAQEAITGGRYDLILLDEFTHLLHLGWLDPGVVTAWLREHRPPELHLVITGRHAPEELIDLADLVTEMREVKHPYSTHQLSAQAGIEF
jgi:cob(I)alamin adenosyltransferase